MKKLIFAFIALFVMVSFAQTTTIVTPSGKNIVYSHTFAADSITAGIYSSAIDLQGYLPQNLYTTPLVAYMAATKSAAWQTDSIGVTIQTRMLTASGTYTIWKTAVDTVDIDFEATDGIAYPNSDSITFNGGRPDQMRFMIAGFAAGTAPSQGNSAGITLKVILVLNKQYGIFQVR